MREHRKLYELVGLTAEATAEDVKRVVDRKKGAFVAEGFRGHFEKEARAVLGDATLRQPYASTGAGYVLSDQRLADADDAWLQELLEGKKTQKPKASGNSQGLLGGAMGWLGINRTQESPASNTLAEEIKGLLASIGAQFEKAEQSGGMSGDAITETNSLLQELVSQCSEDTKVALQVIQEMGVATHIAKLINNPANDLDMKIWSSAVITLVALNEDRSVVTAKQAGIPGIVDLFKEYIVHHANYFNALALEGGEVDLSAVEYQRSICGNILLTLAKVSEGEEGRRQIAEGETVQSLVVYLCSNTPMLSATQVLNVCTILHNVAKIAKESIQQHLPVLVSLLSALSARVTKKLPQVLEAMRHLSAAICEVSGPEYSPVTDIFVKLLAQTASPTGTADVGFMKASLLGALHRSIGSDRAAFTSAKGAVKEKVWDSLVSTVISSIQVSEARAVLDGWVQCRALTGTEVISKRAVMAMLVDEVCTGDDAAIANGVAVLEGIFEHGAGDAGFKAAFGSVVQSVVDKLSQAMSGPLGPRVVGIMHSCIEHSTQLQASIVPHILSLLRNKDRDEGMLIRCAEMLSLVSNRLASSDKVGNESQKYLVQLLQAEDTPLTACTAICSFFTKLHTTGIPVTILKDHATALKVSHPTPQSHHLTTRQASSKECVTLLAGLIDEAKPEPAKEEKKADAQPKKLGKVCTFYIFVSIFFIQGEKSTADVEKKEVKGRQAIVSEEAQSRNPYGQKFETEKKKIQQRIANREQRERQEQAKLQKEQELKNLMKLRKKTTALEQSEEVKREVAEGAHLEEVKKMYADAERVVRKLAKKVREEAEQTAALTRAKEEAMRKAEDERQEETRRQELIRGHNEKLEEERKASAKAAEEASAEAEADLPAEEEGDELDDLLALSSAATKARHQSSLRKEAIPVAKVSSKLGGSYVPPAERRRIEEAEAEKRKEEDAARRRAEARKKEEEKRRLEEERRVKEERERQREEERLELERIEQEKREEEDRIEREREEQEQLERERLAKQQEMFQQQQAQMFPHVIGMQGLPVQGFQGMGMGMPMALPGVMGMGVGMGVQRPMPMNVAGMPMHQMQLQMMQQQQMLQQQQQQQQQARQQQMAQQKAASTPQKETHGSAEDPEQDLVNAWVSVLKKLIELVEYASPQKTQIYHPFLQNRLRASLLPNGVTNESEQSDEQTVFTPSSPHGIVVHTPPPQLLQVWDKHERMLLEIENRISAAKVVKVCTTSSPHPPSHHHRHPQLREFYRSRIPGDVERLMKRSQPTPVQQQPTPPQMPDMAHGLGAAVPPQMPHHAFSVPRTPPTGMQAPEGSPEEQGYIDDEMAMPAMHNEDVIATREQDRYSEGDGFDGDDDFDAPRFPKREMREQRDTLRDSSSSNTRPRDADKSRQPPPTVMQEKPLPAKASMRMTVAAPAPSGKGNNQRDGNNDRGNVRKEEGGKGFKQGEQQRGKGGKGQQGGGNNANNNTKEEKRENGGNNNNNNNNNTSSSNNNNNNTTNNNNTNNNDNNNGNTNNNNQGKGNRRASVCCTIFHISPPFFHCLQCPPLDTRTTSFPLPPQRRFKANHFSQPPFFSHPFSTPTERRREARPSCGEEDGHGGGVPELGGYGEGEA